MIMFQKEFDDYSKMITYLSVIERVDKVSFEFDRKKDKWILNITRFDK